MSADVVAGFGVAANNKSSSSSSIGGGSSGGTCADSNRDNTNRANNKNTNSVYNYHNIFKNIKKCRTCLSTNRQTVPLTTDVPDAVDSANYLQCLRQCTGLSMPETNECGSYAYPMQICLRCCKALEVATHFLRMSKESERKLTIEATKLKQQKRSKAPSQAHHHQQQQQQQRVQATEPELKRKAVKTDDGQFSKQFTQFVQNYEPLIEENVLYMRGTKVPRVELPVENDDNAAGNDIILFDVIYDNTMDEDDENDFSDTKNNETFFESNADCNIDALDKPECIIENGYKHALQNGNDKLEKLHDPNIDSNIIHQALFMACQQAEDGHSDATHKPSDQSECFKQIKADLLKSLENCMQNTLVTKAVPKTDTKLTTLLDNEISDPKVVSVETKVNKVAESGAVDVDQATYSYNCRSCNNFYTEVKESMCLHLREHHKIEKNFELFYIEQQHCPVCQRIFKDQKSLRTHYTRVHATPTNVAKRETRELYSCDNCEKTFYMKSSLISHQRFCKAKDPVRCSFCEKEFNTVRNYELHLQQQHAVSTVHECEVCSNIFKSADSLAMHRKRHTERHFQCTECSLNYINAAELKVHYERTHVRHEEVQCSHCTLTFQNRSLLREHEQRTHQKKLWRCESCVFETTSRPRLRQHQYEHTGYPYKCSVCEEEFTERTKIRAHSIKMHDIELSDDTLAEMFRTRLGYTSRQDAFSKANNSLEIPGFTDDCFDQLKELGLDYDDLTSDLFSNNNVLDSLLDLIP